MPPPLDEDLAGEMATIMTELEAMYGNGTHCFSEDDCYDLEAFEKLLIIHAMQTNYLERGVGGEK